jgi:hypothetical protein
MGTGSKIPVFQQYTKRLVYRMPHKRDCEIKKKVVPLHRGYLNITKRENLFVINFIKW